MMEGPEVIDRPVAGMIFTHEDIVRNLPHDAPLEEYISIAMDHLQDLINRGMPFFINTGVGWVIAQETGEERIPVLPNTPPSEGVAPGVNTVFF